MSGARWIGELRALGVLAVAERLGLALTRGRGLTPCPLCGAEQRGTGDRRGPVGIRQDGAGWRCHRCDAAGDAVSLAAAVVAGRTDPTSWADVRERCRELGLIADDRPRQTRRKPRSAPRPARAPAPGRPAPPGAAGELARPPGVAELWRRCRPVTHDPALCDELDARALDPVRIADRDLARALPADGAALPPWAMFRGEPWGALGHRLIVRMYDAHGRLRSLHARALSLIPDAPGKAPGDPPVRVSKGLNPLGYAVAGLVLADGLARLILADGPPSWCTAPSVVVAEGVPDWLVWTTRASDADEDAPAVVGVVAGSWTDGIAARIPTGARVICRTHADGAGDRYAERIRASLAARCRVLRPQRPRAAHET